MSCLAMSVGAGHLPGCAALRSERGQGDEWVACVALDTYSRERTAGSPTGREPQGDGAPVVVAGVTTRCGAWESQAQGEGAQVLRGREGQGGLRNAEC